MHYMVNFAATSTKKDPELWDSVVSEVKSSSKYGIEGQWNARKASHAVKVYKQRGGKYEGDAATIKNNGLKKWLDEDWRTHDGKPSIKKDKEGNITGISRYLPAKAWDELSPQQKGATNRKKYQAYKDGKQFAPNAKAAKEASRKAREFTYMLKPTVDFSLLPTLLENIHATPQMVRSASNLVSNTHSMGEVAEPFIRAGLKHGKKIGRGYGAIKPVIEALKTTGLSHIMPAAKALATTLPGPQEYMNSMRIF